VVSIIARRRLVALMHSLDFSKRKSGIL